MIITIEDRDQRESLAADWSAAYKMSRSDDEAGKASFKAVPHAGQETVLVAVGPRLLRTLVREGHAHRAGAQAALECKLRWRREW